MSSLPSDADHGDDDYRKMPALPASASAGAPLDDSGWNNLSNDNKLIKYVQDLSSLEAELKNTTDIQHAAKLQQRIKLLETQIAFINNFGAGNNKPIINDPNTHKELSDARNEYLRLMEEYNKTSDSDRMAKLALKLQLNAQGTVVDRLQKQVDSLIPNDVPETPKATLESKIEKPTQDDFTCPICYEHNYTNVVSIHCCRQEFHKHCLEEWLGRRNTCPLCVKKIFIIHDCFTKKMETFQDPPNSPFVPAAPLVRVTPRKASDQLCSIIMNMDSPTARQFLKKYWDKITYEDRSVLLSIHQLDEDEFGQGYV